MPKLDKMAAADPRLIVGGVEATRNEFPFMIDVRVGGHYCGGSLLRGVNRVPRLDCYSRSLRRIGGKPVHPCRGGSQPDLKRGDGTES